MILYKYYGFSSGLAALRSRKLGFREPNAFNDPLELTCFPNSNDTKVDEIKKSVCVLSLTRSPLNPLMWAHYGEEHTGFVIGYDVDIDFLTSAEHNLVSLHDGDVIYTQTKTPHDITDTDIYEIWLNTVGAPDAVTQNNLRLQRLLKKMFLTKHASWAYEEEVRVVKRCDSFFMTSADYQSSPFNSFTTLSRKVAPNFSCDIVKGLRIFDHPVAIKEVYLGIRNPLLKVGETENTIPSDKTLVDDATRLQWSVYKCSPSNSDWNLNAVNVSADSLEMLSVGACQITESKIGALEFFEASKKLRGYTLEPDDQITVTKVYSEVHVQINGDFIE